MILLRPRGTVLLHPHPTDATAATAVVPAVALAAASSPAAVSAIMVRVGGRCSSEEP